MARRCVRSYIAGIPRNFQRHEFELEPWAHTNREVFVGFEDGSPWRISVCASDSYEWVDREFESLMAELFPGVEALTNG